MQVGGGQGMEADPLSRAIAVGAELGERLARADSHSELLATLAWGVASLIGARVAELAVEAPSGPVVAAVHPPGVPPVVPAETVLQAARRLAGPEVLHDPGALDPAAARAAPPPYALVPLPLPGTGLVGAALAAGVADPESLAVLHPFVELLRFLAAWALAGASRGGAMLAALAERLPVAVLGLDREARIVLWNRAAEALFGWRGEEVQGHPLPGPAGDGGELHAALRRAVAAGGGHLLAGRCRLRDGTERALRLAVAEVADLPGVPWALALVEDVTPLQAARSREAATRRELEELLEWLPVAVLELDTGAARAYLRRLASERGLELAELLARDPDVLRGWVARLDVLRANRAALDLFGAAAVEELRFAPERVFLEETVAAAREALLALEPAGTSVHGVRLPVRSGLAVRWGLASALVPEAHRATRDRAIVAIADVTAEIEAVRELESRERQLRELARRTAAYTGREWFAELVRTLSELLGAEVVAVGSPDPANPRLIRTQAWTLEGTLQPPVTYRHEGTPCAEVLRRGRVVVRDRVTERYPEDEFLVRHRIRAYAGVALHDRSGRTVGHLCALWREPPDHPEHAATLLELMAGRAAAELERLEAERRLGESEARHRQLVETAPLGIAKLAPDGRIVFANPAFGALLDEAPARLLGRSIHELVHPEDRGALDLLLEVEGGRERPTRSWELRLVHGGRVREVEAVAAPARAAADGEPVLQLYVLDVTEEGALRRQLLEAQRIESVGRLAGGVAHDFNNVLQALSLNLQLAQRDLPPGSPGRPRLEAMARALERAEAITRQLLLFSRRREPEMRVVSLREVVDGVTSMLRRLVGEDVRIEVRHEGAPPVLADPGQMEQVLMNLVVNARDAMPGGGRITIATRAGRPPADALRGVPDGAPPADRWAALEVADTGTGMDRETLERAFEPLFTTKPEGKGTGLGLAIVEQVVHRHRGTVQVESEPGRGTRFTVWLPGAAAAEERESPRPGDSGVLETPPVVAPRTVLLAEDEDELREAIAEGLAAAGYRVVQAADGAEAVARFEEDPEGIDAAVLDVVMPRLGGPDAAEALRRRRPDLPVLFLSGYDPESRAERVPAGSRLDFLAKPASLATIVARLERLLAGGG